MRKTLTAGLTALSLALMPAAPVEAQQQTNEDMSRMILGLMALGAAGIAIKSNRDNQDTARDQRRATEQVHDDRRHSNGIGKGHRIGRGNGHVERPRRADLMPGRCFRRVETARGGYQGVFDGNCLDRRYRDANTLPRQCAVRMGGRDGHRQGYDAACLRDFGYQSDRRWN